RRNGNTDDVRLILFDHAELKATTDVSNGWLAEQLDMGSHSYVSKHVGNLRKSPPGEAGKWLQKLRKVKGKA
ncbi:MAG: hypothetical protein Q7S40_34800, partial [Opitutaceae bacterium]|nr:hypothetical protein [Opitutaceae bacterium]